MINIIVKTASQRTFIVSFSAQYTPPAHLVRPKRLHTIKRATTTFDVICNMVSFWPLQHGGIPTISRAEARNEGCAGVEISESISYSEFR